LSREEKIRIFKEIYKDIDGFSLSINERKNLNINDKSFVYGEVLPESFCEILEKAQVSTQDIFYDLGSGTGKAVILAKLIFNVQKSVGIEYLESLYQASLEAYEKFKKILNLPDFEKGVEFIKGDLFDIDFSLATILFINSTCFSDEQLAKISEQTLKLEKGSRLIVLTKTIPDKVNYHLEFENQFPFSWGYATVRIYSRI
jgi:SAM-dependent methyltransferase